MSDVIFIRGLRAQAIIGVFAWERKIRQTVLLDLDMRADVARAAATDALDDTIDYKAVAHQVKEFVEKREARLLETLAEQVARLIVDDFGVAWVRVAARKPGAVRSALEVGVVVERAQGDAQDGGQHAAQADKTA